MNEHYNGGGQLWPYFFAADCTAFRNDGMHFHWCSTYTTVFCIVVPIEQFLTFPGFQIHIHG